MRYIYITNYFHPNKDFFSTPLGRGMPDELAVKDSWRGEPGELKAPQALLCLGTRDLVCGRSLGSSGFQGSGLHHTKPPFLW